MHETVGKLMVLDEVGTLHRSLFFLGWDHVFCIQWPLRQRERRGSVHTCSLGFWDIEMLIVFYL